MEKEWQSKKESERNGMKYLKLILLFVVSSLFAQANITDKVTTITNDSSETVSIYYGFAGKLPGVFGFSTSAIDPSDNIDTDREMCLYGFATTSSTSDETDSLAGYVIGLTNEGYLSPDTGFFDFTAYSTGDTLQYLSWTSFSGAIGTGAATWYIDLSSYLKNYYGLKINIVQVAADSNGTGNGIVTSNTIHAAESR